MSEIPQPAEEPMSLSELEQTVVDPEVFGMKYVIEINGQQVATDQTEAELKETANDIERGRVGNRVDDSTGERIPVMIAGKGILTATRQPVTIYMDMKGDLGTMLALAPIEAATPEIEVPAVEVEDVVLPREKFGHGVMNALRARFGIRDKVETFGTDSDVVQTGTNLTILDMSGENNHVRRRILPDHRDGGQQ